uniref:Uncharacterized protein n=1 Tax=Arundo donax TaxID=35708 RepID=A0A0A9GD19_ARUDO
MIFTRPCESFMCINYNNDSHRNHTALFPQFPSKLPLNKIQPLLTRKINTFTIYDKEVSLISVQKHISPMPKKLML